MGTTAESLKKVTPLTELPGYEIIEELGRGTFSIVYKVKKGNETRAIKIFHNDSQIKQAILPETMQEMGMDAIKRYFNNVYKGEARALEKVNTIDPEHIYTCRYYGEYKNDDIRGFIFEYYEGVSLYKHKEKGKFSEWDVQGLMRFIFTALAKIHAGRLIHRDIREENILVGNGSFKLIDFGVAVILEEGSGDVNKGYGSIEYSAPEARKPHGRCGPKADCYAAGVIELELLARFRVEGKSGVPDTNKINKGLNKIKPKLTAKEGSDGKIKPGHDLLCELLEPDPEERLSAEGALKHEWFEMKRPAPSESTLHLPGALKLALRIKK